MRKSTVIVAVFAHNEHLSENEVVSLRQCAAILAEHPIWLILPEELDEKAYQNAVPTIAVKRFPAFNFDGIEAYNKFKISTSLYDALEGFDFLLTYELDSFVFKDDLRMWMDEDFDYIGAPWFEGYERADITSSPIGVGNSGFSLRRVDSCLIVLRRLESLKKIRNFAIKIGGCSTAELFDRILSRIFGSELTKVLAGKYIQEDFFWSMVAPRLSKQFKIPSYEIARLFSFEVNPRRMFNEIGRLPFGCHAWARYDPEFWKSHIPDD